MTGTRPTVWSPLFRGWHPLMLAGGRESRSPRCRKDHDHPGVLPERAPELRHRANEVILGEAELSGDEAPPSKAGVVHLERPANALKHSLRILLQHLPGNWNDRPAEGAQSHCPTAVPLQIRISLV